VIYLSAEVAVRCCNLVALYNKMHEHQAVALYNKMHEHQANPPTNHRVSNCTSTFNPARDVAVNLPTPDCGECTFRQGMPSLAVSRVSLLLKALGHYDNLR